MTNTKNQVNAAEECPVKHGSCLISDNFNDQKKQQFEQEQKLKLSKIKQDHTHCIAVYGGRKV